MWCIALGNPACGCTGAVPELQLLYINTHPKVERFLALAVQSPSRIDYYSSNADIRISVTAHDWLGANCTVTESSTSPVVVRADSPEVRAVLLCASLRPC